MMTGAMRLFRRGLTRWAAYGLIAGVALACGPAVADEDADARDLRACVAARATEDAALCQGIIAEPCTATPEGGTTLGLTDCQMRENRAWDRLLNEEYARAMAAAQSSDQAESAYRAEFARFAASLRDAQRAWIAFRDAECGLEYARYGSGSMRNPANALCLAQMTAERTLRLRRLAEGE